MNENKIILTPNEVKALENRYTAIKQLNDYLYFLRKRQIFNTLKTATRVKLDILNRIKKWFELIEKRIFDDKVLSELPIEKVITLFKFVSQFSLKIFNQTSDLEEIFKAYNESDISKPYNKDMENNEIITDIKKEFMKAVMDGLKEKASEAIIKEEKKIDDDLKKIQESILQEENEKECTVLDKEITNTTIEMEDIEEKLKDVETKIKNP